MRLLTITPKRQDSPVHVLPVIGAGPMNDWSAERSPCHRRTAPALGRLYESLVFEIYIRCPATAFQKVVLEDNSEVAVVEVQPSDLCRQFGSRTRGVVWPRVGLARRAMVSYSILQDRIAIILYDQRLSAIHCVPSYSVVAFGRGPPRDDPRKRAGDMFDRESHRSRDPIPASLIRSIVSGYAAVATGRSFSSSQGTNHDEDLLDRGHRPKHRRLESPVATPTE